MRIPGIFVAICTVSVGFVQGSAQSHQLYGLEDNNFEFDHDKRLEHQPQKSIFQDGPRGSDFEYDQKSDRQSDQNVNQEERPMDHDSNHERDSAQPREREPVVYPEDKSEIKDLDYDRKPEEDAYREEPSYDEKPVDQDEPKVNECKNCLEVALLKLDVNMMIQVTDGKFVPTRPKFDYGNYEGCKTVHISCPGTSEAHIITNDLSKNASKEEFDSARIIATGIKASKTVVCTEDGRWKGTDLKDDESYYFDQAICIVKDVCAGCQLHDVGYSGWKQLSAEQCDGIHPSVNYLHKPRVWDLSNSTHCIKQFRCDFAKYNGALVVQTNLVSDPNNAYCYHDEAGGDSELYELICDGEKHFRYYNNFNYDDYILHAYACVDYY
ncbi:hypothetical protein WR25_23740 [Diploscapter pachys]|uniref:C6 domain-containing protein n=1 Tax=Diploscapter pachys TaxID=2018661 RepID=A0A2A2JFV7_9BILA|nr:hypothetical protein WR25_23740 [Diploscapter pachys]